MGREKTPGDDGISIDLIIGVGVIAAVKRPSLFNKCLSNNSGSLENAFIILIHKNGDSNDLKKY